MTPEEQAGAAIIEHWKAVTPTQRLILLTIALQATKTGFVSTRQDRMADLLGIQSRQFRAHLGKLLARGAVFRVPGKGKDTTIAFIPIDVSKNKKTKSDTRVEEVGHSSNIPKIAGCEFLIGDGGEGSVSKPGAAVQNPEKCDTIIPKIAASQVRTILLSYLESSQETYSPVHTKNPPPLPPFPYETGTTRRNSSIAENHQAQLSRATDDVDLLGRPAALDVDDLLRVAFSTWAEWQKRLGRNANVNLTSSRRRRFLAAWRGLLRGNMTHWRMVCRTCVRNALLAGAVGGWSGATLDWVLFEENLEKVLRGDYREDYDPADPVTKT